METDWLPDDQLYSFLKDAANGNPSSLLSFVAESPLRATDAAFSCLVLIRDHDAWFIEGWHDANAPVAGGGSRLQMINFFDSGFWSKLPVPIGERVSAIRWEDSYFVIVSNRCEVKTSPSQLKAAVMDSMTGGDLSETMILRNFGKLDGTIPLDYPPGWGSTLE